MKRIEGIIAVFIVIIVFFQVAWVDAATQNPDCDGQSRSACYGGGYDYDEINCRCTLKMMGTTQVNIPKSYKQQSLKSKYFTKTSEKNSHTVSGSFMNGHLLSIISGLCSSCVDGMDEAFADANISPTAKVGVMEMVQGSTFLALNNQPDINLVTHLANEWVPGYDRAQYSSFAQSVDLCSYVTDPEKKELCYTECTSGTREERIACMNDNSVTVNLIKRDVSNGWEYLEKSGITPLWSRMLVISYLLFIIAMIIGGFMIMFRNKIGGQVAVTIYNTIPNIVISLVLATFSFAIVGLVINLSVFLSKLFLGIIGFDQTSGYGSKYDYVTGLISMPSWNVLAGNILDSSKVASAGIGESLGLVIVIAIVLFVSIKLFITVFKAYLGIIIDTIFGPLMMTISAIPGMDKLRKQWFNRVIKNALVFPFVLFLINVPGFIKSAGDIFLDMEILSSGQFSTGVSIGVGFTNSIISVILPLVCYHAASKIPDLLSDFFPTETGKGMQAFTQAVGSKIPFISGQFKQG